MYLIPQPNVENILVTQAQATSQKTTPPINLNTSLKKRNLTISIYPLNTNISFHKQIKK